MYPERALSTAQMHATGQTHWAKSAHALIVGNLQTNPFVSSMGRASYQEKGCLLLPIVSHDRRLVGSGLVIFNRPFQEQELESVERICEDWRLLLDTTFAPLLSNLNTAALTSFDGFFLGRVRELRHRITTPEAADEPIVPTEDCFVLNKIALYDAIDSRLSASKPFRLAFFDLDGFKGVNEKLGHQFADVFLFHVAKALVRGDDAAFRPQDDRWLFRFGGDEFVGLCPADVEMEYLSGQIDKKMLAAKHSYDTDLVHNKGHKLGTHPVSSSMGWVDSNDLLEHFPMASGQRTVGATTKKNLDLDDEKCKIYADMREPLLLLELADTHTQERVKDFGKGGWLSFGKRVTLPFNKRSAGDQIAEWLGMINWLGDGLRHLKHDIQFKPPRKLV